jgi:rare lipoprotein A (peptidoglycan hydrolase)
MPGSRPNRRAGAPAVLALLCACALGAGCGDAQPGSPAVGTGRATQTAADAPAASPTAQRATAPRAPAPSASGAGPQPGRHRPVRPAHPVPAAFRPAAGAPSDEEVQRELAQLGTIKRQERERALSAAAANLAGLLPWVDEPKSGIQVSVASVFRDYGLGLACGGLLGRNQLGVAHKTAPCGTLVTFTYNGRSLTVPVIDRGPYIAGREWDLTGATAEALGFPGLGQIAWSLAR